MKISLPEFVIADGFWANQNRWNTTPQYQTEKQFYKLAENTKIAFYVNEKPKRFKNFRNVRLRFSDEFDEKTLSTKHWNVGFQYKNPKLILTFFF